MNLKKELYALEDKFSQLNAEPVAVKFKQECMFALQALNNSPYLQSIAQSNENSLKGALLNLATIGITLNPANKYAYLVPRRINKRPSICLDISYMGLIHLAQLNGAISYIQAKVVREGEEFFLNGIDKEPTHKLNPFNKNGKIIGAYSVAKLSNGDYLTESMSIDEIYAIRDKSESYKAFLDGKAGQSPWTEFEEEMIKKTVIKRQFKTLPSVNQRALEAIDIDNKANGIDFRTDEQKKLDETREALNDDYQRMVEESDPRQEHQKNPSSLEYVFYGKPPKFSGKYLVELDCQEVEEYYNKYIDGKEIKSSDWLEAKEALDFYLENKDTILDIQEQAKESQKEA